MSDDSKSSLLGRDFTEVRINPVGAIVKRVVTWGRGLDLLLYRVEFYDKNDVLILAAGDDKGNAMNEFIV